MNTGTFRYYLRANQAHHGENRFSRWRREGYILMVEEGAIDGSEIPPQVAPQRVKIIMVCEAMPDKEQDYFYSSQDSLFMVNTVDAFRSAGQQVKDINDIVERGVYLTVAVKSPREGQVVPAAVIEENSYILEEELKQFPNVRAILLMGDAAIKAINYISLRRNRMRAIPAGSTYKIRKGEFYFNGIRIFPSYLQTGKNFLIEKSKRAMVAEDIKHAFKLLA